MSLISILDAWEIEKNNHVHRPSHAATSNIQLNIIVNIIKSNSSQPPTSKIGARKDYISTSVYHILTETKLHALIMWNNQGGGGGGSNPYGPSCT